MINQITSVIIYIRRKLWNSQRGSPLVEESILLGISLFAFMILATVVFDLVEFARTIFEEVTNGLDQFPA